LPQQAPSDYPDMAEWLVECGIDSISLNPDTAIKTALIIAEKEARQQRAAAEMRIGARSGTDRRASSHPPRAAAPRVRRCQPAASASSAES
jgi:hypothetical protein